LSRRDIYPWLHTLNPVLVLANRTSRLLMASQACSRNVRWRRFSSSGKPGTEIVVQRRFAKSSGFIAKQRATSTNSLERVPANEDACRECSASTLSTNFPRSWVSTGPRTHLPVGAIVRIENCLAQDSNRMILRQSSRGKCNHQKCRLESLPTRVHVNFSYATNRCCEKRWCCVEWYVHIML